MLPSDLEEALKLKLKINPDYQQTKQRREACENQYYQWSQGINQYLAKSKDETKIECHYTFDGLNGINYYRQQHSQTKTDLENTTKKLTQIHQENKILKNTNKQSKTKTKKSLILKIKCKD
ncbi:conserved hypothetical protein [Aster yellows witches'-broom phytoplasma AYWB]|uniref:Uncharacterized protein n=1 Tax=Aster yellows witches'-broom phytoplasma (strain AYWB) TaxID=322098 RepID=Q2NJC8_AYWBP|nr:MULTISPECIES: hypothetical protein [16SrI (Aster yellows group)]ABC65465.1 conserved hypothetical protein [Aster yellows witches'-broom phytoplasma AYWB]